MTTISVRIDETEKEMLQQFAKQHDLTVSQVIRRAIKDFFIADELNKTIDAFNQIPN